MLDFSNRNYQKIVKHIIIFSANKINFFKNNKALWEYINLKESRNLTNR
jgi:hypothetical protein